jgi:hypothetical protein
MNSWMKRRINRSRARCQKSSLANKQKMRRKQSEAGRSKQEAITPHALSHPASAK